VLEDLIIADITEIDDAQIILGRPFLATIGCNIEVKRGRLTFEVQGCYAMFCYIEEKVVSPNSLLLGGFPLSSKINMEDVLNCQGPPDFDWISNEDPDEGYVKVEFVAPTPPSTPEIEAHASNESTMSDYYKFAQVVLSLPAMQGVDAGFDLGIEQGDSSQSGEPCTQFVCILTIRYGIN